MQSSWLPGRTHGGAIVCSPGQQCLPNLARSAWITNGLRWQCWCWEHCINSACGAGVLSLLHLPFSGSRLSISCHSPAHQQCVHITRLSAKQLMRLGSKLSVIFVSLLCLGNILAPRNKETWATMAQSQAFLLPMDARS